MEAKEAHVAELVHEIADALVNWGGYADDADEADRRAGRRDDVEGKLARFVGELA